MENPHSYILKTYATIVSSSSSINTLGGPIFLLVVFPYKWSNNEVMGMPHNLLTPHKEVMLLSIASTVASNDSLNHLPLGFVAGTLFVLANLCIMFDILKKDIIFFLASCQSNTPFCFLQGTSNIMMLLIFLDPTSKSLVECS